MVQESEAAQQARCPRAPPPARAPVPAAPPPAGEPGRCPALSPLPLQAMAGGQRRPGEAAAGLAEGAAGGALEADAGRVAPPGAGRGPAGLGSPRLPTHCHGSCNKAALKQTAVAASLGGWRGGVGTAGRGRAGTGTHTGAADGHAGVLGPLVMGHRPTHTCPGWPGLGVAPTNWGGSSACRTSPGRAALPRQSPVCWESCAGPSWAAARAELGAAAGRARGTPPPAPCPPHIPQLPCPEQPSPPALHAGCPPPASTAKTERAPIT